MLTFLLAILGVAITGAVGWNFSSVVQLFSRTDKLETRHDDLILLINTRFDNVGVRLERIERVMNGSLKH